jgi:hypothetical protein
MVTLFPLDDMIEKGEITMVRVISYILISISSG